MTAVTNETLKKKIISICKTHKIDAECILNTRGAFTEQILNDLIRQGYEGQALLDKFIDTNRKVRPAVEALISEAENMVKNRS